MSKEISKYELWKIRCYKYAAGTSYIADSIGSEQHERMPRPFSLVSSQQERPCEICGKVVYMIRRQRYCPACSMKSKKDREIIKAAATAKGSF